ALHARGGAGLAKKALDDDGRIGELGRQDLDGHPLADADVLALVHRGHPPAAYLAGDLVLAHEQGTHADLVLWLDGGHVGVGGGPGTKLTGSGGKAPGSRTPGAEFAPGRPTRLLRWYRGRRG